MTNGRDTNLENVERRPVAALYARISQDEQSFYSLEVQITKMRQYATAHGLTVGEGYVFAEDFTATRLDRPELNRIRALIRIRAFDALIVYSSDRFNRGGPALGQLLREELRQAGVELHYVTRGRVELTPAGERDSHTEDIGNRGWLDQVRRASMLGRQRKAEKGVHPGGGQPPYGYRREGHGDDTRYVILDEQAAIVRQIFTWYDEGVSPREIARRLHGVPTKSDQRDKKVKRRAYGEWSAGYIYPMLRNETYAGTAWVNQVKMVDGREVPRPREEWLGISAPAIIDRELWERCQKRIAERREQSQQAPKYEYLMVRRLTCACGYAIVSRPSRSKGVHFFYYACSTSHSQGSTVAAPCGLPYFRLADVDGAAWELAVRLLNDRPALIAALQDMQQALREQQVDAYDRLATIERQIATNRAELERLARALAKEEDELFYGIITSEVARYRDVLKELTAERDRIQKKLRPIGITDDDMARIERFADEVAGRLPRMDFAERRRAIEELNLRGTLSVEGEQRIVSLHWYARTYRTPLKTARKSSQRKARREREDT